MTPSGPFTYDGDTPQDARKAIRARGHIILTNPDMLHTGILPHHTKWIKLFENLKYIVIDELHNYRGIFGSHLANILRRLKRIAKFYGAQPQFILCTATIANPLEIAEKMTEEPVSLVDNNGAPSGEKYFIFFNPPVVNKFLGIRRSYVNESRRIASLFIKSDLQTIVFARSRLITEILVTYLKEDIEKTIKNQGLIRGYRGGYLPLKRREIEKGLREGTIKGVISTNALELGIDIGSLDIAVLAGYPGTISSTWQRAGRAGRKTGKSAAVLVASSAPIDQFIINHPDYFFSKNPEKALINPDNLSILVSHIECATFELPFAEKDKFGGVEIGDATQVVGFKKIKFYTAENVGAGDLSLPENEMHTTAYWLTIPSEIFHSLPFSTEQKINGLFGVAYLLHHVSPLFMMCDLHDVGISIGDNTTGKSVPPRNIPSKIARDEERPDFTDIAFEPNIFIFDNFPGGIGLSPSLFDLEKELLKHCQKTITACPCKEGCPSCVGPTKESGKQAKQVALEILISLI